MSNYDIDALTAEEWEALANQATPASPQQLEQLGFIEQSQQQVTPEQPKEEKEYENLGYIDTLKDEAKAGIIELSKFFTPKDKELQYTPRTKAGEAFQNYSKWIYGMSGLALGGELAAGAKAASIANNAPKAVSNTLGFISKALGGDKFFTTASTNIGKKAGVGALNFITQGSIAGGLLDANLRNPYEGRLADMMSDTDNPIINWFKTDENDSLATEKFKSVVEGAILNMGFNAGFSAIKPIFAKYLKNSKAYMKAESPEVAETVLKEVIKDEVTINKIANSYDLLEEVKGIKSQVDETGEDGYQLILDRMSPDNHKEAQAMLKTLDSGEDIFIHTDGTWDIKVNNWDDAHKVTPEEYNKQLKTRDEIAAMYDETVKYGDTALIHQDEAVKHTWTNRGWIGENEVLNQSISNKIAKNYKDKWKIDNNIKIEWVDGLKHKGEYVEGLTKASLNTGKKIKDTQIPIDKKNVQIQELENKIHALEQQADKKQTKSVLSSLKKDVPKLDYVTCRKQWNYWRKSIASPLERAFKDGVDSLNDVIQTMVKNVDEPISVEALEQQLAKGLKDVPTEAQADFYEELYKAVAKVEEYQAKLTPADKLSILKEKLRIAKKEKTGLENPNIAKDISIKIDKNAKNPYATLRAELEHARDIAKGEVPKQSDKHFSRYEGINEGEVASGYVYKKAQGKANYVKAQDTINIVQARNEAVKAEGYTFHEGTGESYANSLEIRDANGNSLGVCEYEIVPEGIYADATATGEGGGLVEKSIDYLIEKYPDKPIIWDAINQKSENIRQYLLKKHPEYNGKIVGKSFDEIDKEVQLDNNMSKGDINEANNNSQNTESLQPRGSKSSSANQGQNESNRSAKPSNDKNGSLSSSYNGTDGTRGTSNFDTQPSIITKTLEESPEISGFKWENIANDADKLNAAWEAVELYSDPKLIKEAFANNDVQTMDIITRKALTAQKVISQLYEQAQKLPKDVDIAVKREILDTVKFLQEYTKETGSASGRSLQARKLINIGQDTFGSSQLSEMTKEGIYTFSDLLATNLKEIFNLEFTRGMSVKEMKEAVLAKLLQADQQFTDILVNDGNLRQKFSELLDSCLKNRIDNPEIIYKQVEDFITENLYDEVMFAAKLADKPEGFFKTIKNWVNQQGGVTSYYIHNLLSGVGTLAKNIISGGMNTIYFPMKKVVAGMFFGGGEEMTKEGLKTFSCLKANWDDAWTLCKQAFLNGEGKLTNVKEAMNMTEEEIFNGFRHIDWNDTTPQGIWHSVQNFHSLMTRAMMASDELMTQLNYRSIVRAKALTQAETLAQEVGKINDTEWINTQADKLFKQAFSVEGKPLDTQAFAEAKDILYQLPLDGKMFNHNTGEYSKVRDNTWVSDMAQAVQSATVKVPFLKIMFPFVKTGANILQMNLEHNAIYSMLSTSQRNLLLSKTSEGALARSQVAMGMLSFMTAVGFAMSGRITGSAPVDPKERKALFETGWKPYSVRVGGQYVSYQGYEPLQTVLGFAADSVNIGSTIINSDDEKKWNTLTSQVLALTVNNFLDKAAFRSGLKQMAVLTEPDSGNVENFKKQLAQTAQGFLPDVALVRNISSVGKRAVTQPQGVYERLLNNYFNRGLGDYRRDVFGNKQNNYGYIVTNAGTDNTSDVAYNELMRLSAFGFNPTEISKTISGTGLKFTEFKDSQGHSAYDAMQEELSTLTMDGRTLQEAVKEVIESEEYQLKPDGVNQNGIRFTDSDDTKINTIKALFIEYNEEAKQRVIENNTGFFNRKGLSMSEAQEEVQANKLMLLNDLF